MTDKSEEPCTYKVIRQRHNQEVDGTDYFFDDQVVLIHGLTRAEAATTVNALQERHKRDADIDFFFLPE